MRWRMLSGSSARAMEENEEGLAIPSGDCEATSGTSAVGVPAPGKVAEAALT